MKRLLNMSDMPCMKVRSFGEQKPVGALKPTERMQIKMDQFYGQGKWVVITQTEKCKMRGRNGSELPRGFIVVPLTGRWIEVVTHDN